MSGPHISNDGPWTLGIKVGLPFALFGLVALLALIVVCIVWERHDTYSDGIGYVIAGFCTLGLLGLVGGCLFAYYPYNSAYHQYREVTGTVSTVSSRLVSAGDDGGTDQKFVVTFEGSTQPFGVNDTRASLLHRGDHLTIACIRSYEYGGTAGYDCKWRSAS